MWLFTKHGFYSVVTDERIKGNVQVRARVKADLQALARLAAANGLVSWNDWNTQETPLGDYRYRVSIPKATWNALGILLVDGIDYPNFKNAALKGQHNTPRSQAYHRIWSIMSELQSTLAAGVKRAGGLFD